MRPPSIPSHSTYALGTFMPPTHRYPSHPYRLCSLGLSKKIKIKIKLPEGVRERLISNFSPCILCSRPPESSPPPSTLQLYPAPFAHHHNLTHAPRIITVGHCYYLFFPRPPHMYLSLAYPPSLTRLPRPHLNPAHAPFVAPPPSLCCPAPFGRLPVPWYSYVQTPFDPRHFQVFIRIHSENPQTVPFHTETRQYKYSLKI